MHNNYKPLLISKLSVVVKHRMHRTVPRGLSYNVLIILRTVRRPFRHWKTRNDARTVAGEIGGFELPLKIAWYRSNVWKCRPDALQCQFVLQFLDTGTT